jgi:hypothetical protein
MSRHLYPAAIIAAVLAIAGCGGRATPAASASATVLPASYDEAVFRPEPFWATAQGIILIATVVIAAALVAAWRMSRSR